ncbi:MAG: 30S ribosomal protein S2 [Candidatus Lindowbacteria bacterium]|nr:30S ribosomal protein S2 [Candidatus Lindowbacteria bacterium]
MAIVTMKQLLEAGVHFGHQARRWNPKMRKFIFGERNGVYIIDLQKTIQQVNAVYHFIRETVENGGTVLFVGTKRHEAKKLEIPSVGIVDTNCDPDDVTYPIPGNDDAIRSIKLFTTFIADAVLDAKARTLEGREVPGTELGAGTRGEEAGASSNRPSALPEEEEDDVNAG